MKPKKLTPKQRLFVEHYLVTNDKAEAAKLAGYSGTYAGKNAFRIMDASALVRAAVERARAVRTKRTLIDQDWVIKRLVSNVDKADATDPPNLTASNKALELLGKQIGMFKETAPVGDVINITKIERIIVHSKDSDGAGIRTIAGTVEVQRSQGRTR